MGSSRNNTGSSATPEETSEPELELLIGYNLKRAYVVLQTGFREVMGEDGFSPRVFSALSFVVRFPNLTQSDLARRLGIERSGLVAIIDQLEEKGLLRRVVVPGDRRAQALKPTAKGVRVCSETTSQVRDNEDRNLEMLSPEEKEQLLTLLKKIRLSAEETV